MNTHVVVSDKIIVSAIELVEGFFRKGGQKMQLFNFLVVDNGYDEYIVSEVRRHLTQLGGDYFESAGIFYKR